jgi:hypothetical protein
MEMVMPIWYGQTTGGRKSHEQQPTYVKKNTVERNKYAALPTPPVTPKITPIKPRDHKKWKLCPGSYYCLVNGVKYTSMSAASKANNHSESWINAAWKRKGKPEKFDLGQFTIEIVENPF